MVEVTESDKLAARSILWVQTLVDDIEAIEQTFATHREAAAKAGRDEGIIEGRRQAFEEAAKVAEDEMKHWDSMASTVGCGVQRQQIFKGKANVADSVWQKLRSLK